MKEKIEDFYEFIKNLPHEEPENFSLITSGFKQKNCGDYDKVFYTSFVAANRNYFCGLKKRTKIWKEKILPEYNSLSLEQISEENSNLSFKVSNHFFRSRLNIKQKDSFNLDVWSPKFSTLASCIFGNMVKAKFKTN